MNVSKSFWDPFTHGVLYLEASSFDNSRTISDKHIIGQMKKQKKS
jgi:hypothetical protein